MHEAVIYDQGGGGEDWTFQRDNAEIAVTLKGRLRVSAAEGVRAAVLADAGIAIASEWMFAPEIKDGTVKVVLPDWKLPRIDLWAVFPAGRTATTKARIFTQFVEELMRVPSGAASSGGPDVVPPPMSETGRFCRKSPSIDSMQFFQRRKRGFQMRLTAPRKPRPRRVRRMHVQIDGRRVKS